MLQNNIESVHHFNLLQLSGIGKICNFITKPYNFFFICIASWHFGYILFSFEPHVLKDSVQQVEYYVPVE